MTVPKCNANVPRLTNAASTRATLKAQVMMASLSRMSYGLDREVIRSLRTKTCGLSTRLAVLIQRLSTSIRRRLMAFLV